MAISILRQGLGQRRGSAVGLALDVFAGLVAGMNRIVRKPASGGDDRLGQSSPGSWVLGFLVLALVLVPVAGAGSGPYVAGDLRPKRHPKTYYVHPPGVSFSLTSLAWKGWGKPQTRAVGKLKVCVNGVDTCERLGRVRFRLWRLRHASCEGIKGRYYTRGAIIRRRGKTPLDLSPSRVC